MKLQGKCRALRIYIDEEIKWKGGLLYRAIVENLLRIGIAGATVFKGIEGYGSSAHIHTARILEITENLPVMIEVVAKPKSIQLALKAIEEMLPQHCLVTVQEVTVLRFGEGKAGRKKSS